MKALFDTNILIDYLKGSEPAQAGDVIDMFLRDFRVVDVTRAIARGAVDIRQTARIRLPDAIIWSSARHESALLVTCNTKDFPADEPGVRIPYLV